MADKEKGYDISDFPRDAAAFLVAATPLTLSAPDTKNAFLHETGVIRMGVVQGIAVLPGSLADTANLLFRKTTGQPLYEGSAADATKRGIASVFAHAGLRSESAGDRRMLATGNVAGAVLGVFVPAGAAVSAFSKASRGISMAEKFTQLAGIPGKSAQLVETVKNVQTAGRVAGAGNRIIKTLSGPTG